MCYVWFVGCSLMWLLFIDGCLLFVVYCWIRLLCVVKWLLCVRCAIVVCVVGRVLFNVGCWLCVVCCMLLFVCC